MSLTMNHTHMISATAGRLVLALAFVILAAPGAEAACLDNDGDGYTTCQNDCDDGNANVNPGLDDSNCDGLDNDCNGLADDGYIPVPTTCGVGPCYNNGKVWCIAGVLTDSCTPKESSPDDTDCNGIDDDCDGSIDEDFVNATVTCGFGTCESTGTVSCENGSVESTCVPSPPEGVDHDCDGFDDDCDGLTDEHWAVTTTWCGEGACTESGQRKCIDGAIVDTCTPSAPTNDADCDGVDDDCDGSIDEHFTPIPVTCGEGACTAEGAKICDDGDLVTQCEPVVPATGDNDCDGFDDDCDGWPDDEYIAPLTSCGVGACASAGKARCIAGTIEDTCEPGMPAAFDATCDGIDDDCDGQIDEDYVSVTVTCGEGGCVATGSTSCEGGVVVQICTPGTPAENDASCDGVDDDCDGWADEDFAPIGTTCGSGACADAGNILCIQGEQVDTCNPNGGAEADLTCDGIDDDCDGETDEDYLGEAISCGTGACTAEGTTTCVGGVVMDVCTPGTPAEMDTLCNGIDDDCDGPVDEDWVVTDTFCGSGACAAEGALVCTDGAIVDTCEADLGQAQDIYCDGIDNDCDGLVDEEFVSESISCGTGACQAEGATVCQGGQVIDQCTPVDPGGPDDDCNGIDDDCDGFIDDGWVIVNTSCGAHGCASAGKLHCVDGEVSDTCTPIPAADSDAICDGLDEDCDGLVDEDWVAGEVTCGIGACFTTGSATCSDGAVMTTCEPAAPGTSDVTCDGVDDDCNGVVDDAFTPVPTACGIGACQAVGTTTCEDGAMVDTCTPSPAEGADADCDGIDNNCDGAIDEGWTPAIISCGVGACAIQVESTCADGVESTSCEPGPPSAAIDASCDGVDDDCDGLVDEDHVAPAVTCGIGACAATGQAICQDGALVEVCDAGTPAAADDVCDGFDDDCDGQVDEDVASVSTSCGVGACASAGDMVCMDGVLTDTCTVGSGATSDATCDGIDDDCDGSVDEEWASTVTSCGVGVCANEGATVCQAGVVEDTCTATEPTDESCNGQDDDCDGVVDESLAVTPTTCGAGACVNQGQESCEGGQWVDSCTPHEASADDASCDGVDNDCDGQVDEDAASQITSCGSGACAATGEMTCESAQWVDSCSPGDPSAIETCNGVDDDCDGTVDEDVTPVPTTCGVGACAAEGQSVCEGGALVDTCAPGPSEDETCNGVDDDCNGHVDDGIDPVAITCGVGACETPGERTCEAGVLVDTCAPDLASAEVCNGIDDDCDGQIDEDVTPVDTTCGTGACTSEGQSICVDGALVDTCEAGDPSIELCNGLDDDCNGAVDDGVNPVVITCGQGACATEGEQVCEGGAWTDVCPVGVGNEGTDTTCDGFDDDCDGVVDDDVVPEPITCGVGSCLAEGELLCQDGAWVDTCEVASSEVEMCNGVDDDCDGDVDEETNGTYYTVTQGSISATFEPVDGDTDVTTFYGYDETLGASTSGMNASNTTRIMLYRDPDGVMSLVFTHDDTTDGSAGRMRMRIRGLYQGEITVHDDAPSKADRYYYNQDKGKARLRWGWGGDDADGAVIEGVDDELCIRVIPRRPRGIETVDIIDGDMDATPISLDPTIAFRICAVTCCTPDAGGEVCDGVDNDCDGEIDEDLSTEVTECGHGPCADTGHSYCDDGVPVDTCTPGEPAHDTDASCNDVDDDCDGVVDDDFPTIPTTCGTGTCQAEGVMACEGGAMFNTCVALGTGGEEVCDGLDNDCDGDVDEQATGAHYVVSRGDMAVPITPLHSGTDVATFYGYDTTHSWSSDTGYESSDRVTLMLHQDPTGDLGLVMLLDAPSDGTGGNVVFTMDGMESADVAVLDDPGGQYDSWDPHTGTLVARWSSCCTDGVAFSDLDDDLCITIHQDWMQGMSGFDVITGDDGSRVSLPDGDESVTICVVPCCEPDDGGESCDGIDNDCDGVVDEDQDGGLSTCGVGACASEGVLLCEAGGYVDTCTPGWPLAAQDTTCDGVDDDCDGMVDEDFVAGATSCGQGVCAATGEQTCDGGVLVDTCTPLLFESHTDDTCDGVDNDCDGTIDDDVQVQSVTCGEGACASPGERFCVDGEVMDICEAVPTTAEACNGLDDDCDGVADNDVTGSYFVLTQGETSVPVSPIHSGTDLATFYSYNVPNHASANTGYEMSDRGTLLVHADPDGARSLVMIFDAVNDGTGGRVEVNVSGLGQAEMTLLDDPSAAQDSWDVENGDLTLRWWACCTDGAAFAPLDEDGCVTITPEVLIGIDGFDVVTGDEGDRITLRNDLSPITLCVAHCCAPGTDGEVCEPAESD